MRSSTGINLLSKAAVAVDTARIVAVAVAVAVDTAQTGAADVEVFYKIFL